VTDIITPGPEILDPDTTCVTYNISHALKAAQEKIERLTALFEAQITRFDNLHDDWLTLNGFLNGYAQDEGLCSAYEDKLNLWNESFSEGRLEGRYKEYDVSVKVTATYWTTVTVNALDTDDATEKVGEMRTRDIADTLDWTYSNTTDVEFDCEDVSLA
jgi:hypothetical protein